MTDENKGAASGGEDANANAETSKNQDGGENANVNVEQLKSEIEELRKATSGKDVKISALLDAEKELKNLKEQMEKDKLAQQTVEEQAEHYKLRLEKIEREQVLTRELAGLGISVSDAKTVLEADTAEAQAKALANLVKEHSEKISQERVDEFKQNTIAGADKEKPRKDENNEDAVSERMKSAALQ